MYTIQYRNIEWKLANTEFNASVMIPNMSNSLDSEPITRDTIFQCGNCSPSTFVSCGGGTGATWELMASKMYDKVYCLEPEPYSFHEFEENIKANGSTNIVLENMALFDDSKENITLNLCHGPGYGGSSIFQPNKHKKGSITVPCISLRKYFDKHNIQKNAVLNLDLEGAEYILFNDTEFFKIYRPLIILELHWQIMEQPEIDIMNKGLEKLKSFYSGIETEKYFHQPIRALNTIFVPF